MDLQQPLNLWLNGNKLVSQTADGARYDCPLRYRKSAWLLAYAIQQPRALISREALAEWFWPQHEASDARRNLRVVLTDVQQALRQSGLESCLRVHRDWVRWEHRASQLAAWPADLPSQPGGGGESHPALSSGWGEPPTAAVAPPAATPPPALHLKSLAVLHVRWHDPDAPATAADANPAWRQQLQTWLQRYSAHPIELGSESLTLALGLHAQSAAYRSDALRLAGHLHSLALAHGLSLHIGATFGPLLVQGASLQPQGWRLKLAERLAAFAEDHTLVCDQSHADQAQFLDFEALGHHSFRGFARRFELYRCALQRLAQPWPHLVAQSHLPLVGRDAPLAHLQATLQQARQRQRSQTLLLSGPPGMGKTRLALQLWRQEWINRRSVAWIEGRPEDLSQPWSSLRRWVTQRLASPTTERPPLAQELLLGFCTTGGVAQGERSALVQALLHGFAPELWVLDDAQWIDPTSLELLGQLAQRTPPSLWLLTVRPGGEHVAAPLPGPPHILELPPLQPTDAKRLWRLAVGQADASDPESAPGLADPSAPHGRPLWLLAGARHGDPGALAGDFQTRLNILGEHRSLLDATAWLGLHWQLADAQALLPTAALAAVLEQAQSLDLLAPAAAGEWCFFHPAVRDYVLQTQSGDVKAHWMERVAQLRQRQRAWGEAAALWSQLERADQARPCWQHAALEAMERGDFHAAAQHFAALRALGYCNQDTHPMAVRLRLAHAQARMVAGGYGDALIPELAEETRRDMQALGLQQAPDWDGVRFGSTFLQYLSSSSNGLDGLDFSAQLRALAHTPAQHLVAAWAEGNTRFWRGEHDLAAQWLQQALDWQSQAPLPERRRIAISDPIVFVRSLMLWLRALRGDPEADIAAEVQAAYAALAQSPSPQDECILLCHLGFCAYTDGDTTALVRHARRVLDIASEQRYRLWLGIAQLQLQLGLTLSGQGADWAAIDRAVADVTAGYRAGLPTGQWMVADMLRASGQPEQALALCEQWLAQAPQQEHRHCAMDIHRIRAQSLHALGQDPSPAWAEARQAGLAGQRWGWLRRWHLDGALTTAA